jgi:hypothetical protein
MSNLIQSHFMNHKPLISVKLIFFQACRRSCASKSAVRKVSKHVALAFVKRTLARCRKFEDTGASCFSEPALQDVLFSVSPCNNDTKSVDCVGSGTASNTCNEASHQAEARGSGMSSEIFTCSFMMAIMPFVR